MKFERVDMKALEAELIAIRREFHRYPETAWTEFRTTARIIEELKKLGLEPEFGPQLHVPEKMYGMPKPEVLQACYDRALKESDHPEWIKKMKGGFTGCLVTVEGAKPGPTVGIRVDIDCNDVDEAVDEKHVPYRDGYASTHPMCMHACGHDAHAAIGIGTAKLLKAYQDELEGRVLLVFQPGEEGLRGAASMTAAGLFDKCDYFLGAHIGLRSWPTGTIAAGSYGFLSSTKFDVMFHGKAAHAGAAPEMGCNAIAAASSAVLNMLAISRHHEGSSRINVGTFHGGTGRNVIPGEAELTVETRGGTDAINAYMEEAATRVCRAAGEMYGCTVETRFMGAAGGVECDKEVIDKALKVLPGVEGVVEVKPLENFGGGEDVTTMMKAVQKNGGKVSEMIFGFPLVAAHHNNYFDIDENVIGIGARAFAALALNMSK